MFTKVISVMELIPPTEKAALLAERETRATKKPLTPTPRKVAEFEKLRNAFFNRSPRHLRQTPSPPAKPATAGQESQVSNTQTGSQKLAICAAALKRSAILIYKFLKPKTVRSDSEQLLFIKVNSIMELIPPTEKEALLAEREMRATKKPLTPTLGEVENFERLRNAFFNKSLRLSQTPSVTVCITRH